MVKDILHSAKYLAEDLASLILFVLVLETSHQVLLAAGCGMALGVGQIAWRLARRAPIDAMQWLSVALVVVGGAATFLTRDPRFIMVKPSVINVVVGLFMLKPGWMTRYLPPIAQQMVPDVAVVFGFVWAGLMFATAGLNLVLALRLDPLAWAQVMGLFGLASMAGLFVIQTTVMRVIGYRRHRRAGGGAVAEPSSALARGEAS